jgi:DNA primase catalytic core
MDINEAKEKLLEFFPDYLESQGILDAVNKPFQCLSPKHTDTNPSCTLIPNSVRAYCHSCGERFSIFDAYSVLEKKSIQGAGFVEAIKVLSARYNVPFTAAPMSEEKQKEVQLLEILGKAKDYIVNCEPSKECAAEFKRRKWDVISLRETNTGSINDFTTFYNYLLNCGYSDELLKSYDFHREDLFSPNNIIYSYTNEQGYVVGFVGRKLKYNKETEDKYVSQNNTKNFVFRKNKRLFNFHAVCKNSGPLFLVEGQGDAITAIRNGIKNVIAIGSTSITTEHLLLLKEYNQTNLILCFDGDEPGQKKIGKLLKEKFTAHKDIKVSVKLIPGGQDPDDYIREHGKDAFLTLNVWSSFEWRLHRYLAEEETDLEKICLEMLPYIAMEPSFIEKEKMAKTLANTTNWSFQAISSEVARLENSHLAKINNERKSILDRAFHEAKVNPDQAEIALTGAIAELHEASKVHSQNKLSEESFLNELYEVKKQQEEKGSDYNGFDIGSDLSHLNEGLLGDWDKDVLVVVAGSANSGKTALCAKLCYSIASAESNNALCLFLSIDDTQKQFIPRLVSIADSTKDLSINMIANPGYFGKKDPSILEKRNKGFSKVENLIKSGRLVVKDNNHGNSLGYAETLIKYYKEKYPARKIVFFLDNFHLLTDYKELEERIRFKRLSHAVKALATRHHISIVSTMEYTKLAPGIKPSNNSLSESVAMEYDANLILHLYNDMHSRGPNADIFHTVTRNGEKKNYPRIEAIFGKNKISSFKGSVYLDFYPDCSDFISVPDIIVQEELAAYKASKGNKMNNKHTVSETSGLLE